MLIKIALNNLYNLKGYYFMKRWKKINFEEDPEYQYFNYSEDKMFRSCLNTFNRVLGPRKEINPQKLRWILVRLQGAHAYAYRAMCECV
jgi:hypothetical protein